MTDSEELRAKVDANVKKLSYIEDKAQVETGIGVTLASLFGFTLLLSFFALWISAEYDNHAPLAVDLAFYSALVLWVIVTTVLGAALANIALGIRLRKQTSALRDEVNALEKAEMEIESRKLANTKAAELADVIKRKDEERVRAAQAASDAREAQAKAHAVEMDQMRAKQAAEDLEASERAAKAERVAKAVQETRQERRAEQGKPPLATGDIVKPVQRDSDGPRKPGGSPTQGKGSSPRKEL